MATGKIELTDEQEAALREGGGFAEGSSCVVMSKDTYRRMMGIETDDDLAKSLAAIDRALADIQAGRVQPLDDFLTEFKERHEISG